MAQELAGEKLIERSIYIFGITEALHLAGLFKHVPLSTLAGIALPAWLAAAVLFAVKDMLIRRKKRNRERRRKAETRQAFESFLTGPCFSVL